ncbi:uncharacterized protein LOC135135077 [Zophobas morio]|uniref:uncharacterized protein LOC135135077 n=1 Tax=Zophobas morio TaxID=2755281 RepID=UPI0030828146
MKKAIFVAVGVLVALQQVFSATDDEVQQAYTELEDLTYEAFEKWDAIRTNYTERFLENLALDRLDAKLTMDSRLGETLDKVNALIERTNVFDSVDTTECIWGLNESLTALRASSLESLDICLYDNRYTTGFNIVAAKWTTIVHLGMDFLVCTQRAAADCQGDEACGDKIITEIEQKKTDSPMTINMLGENMIATLDSLPIRCKDQILTQYNDNLADTVETVGSCIDRLISSFAPLLCSADKK